MRLINVYYRFAQFIDRKYSRRIKDVEDYLQVARDKVGIEIGGPSAIFTPGKSVPVYPVATRIDGVNFTNQTIWEGTIQAGQTYRYLPGKTGQQFISEAADLQQIKSESYDFLVSSHCLEHCANPVKTLMEWKRVTKREAGLIIIVPHYFATFDRRRPVTTIGHMIEDYQNNTPESDLTHAAEVIALHDFSKEDVIRAGKEFNDRIQNNFSNRSMHHHVFNGLNFAQLLNYAGLQIDRIDIRVPHHLIALTHKTEGSIDNTKFLEPGYYSKNNPFPD